MKSHPQVKQWVQSIFHGKKRDFNRFVKEQSQSGIFTDANGLAVIATADYLGVNYHIVGTSNNERNPVSKYGRFNENRPIFHIGYYQDTTDHPYEAGSTRAGHYQSLEPIPGHPLSCCGGHVQDPIPQSPPLLVIQQPTPERENVVSKIINEETILKVLVTQKSIVGQSLQRLIDMKNEIMVDTLFETEICKILMERIRPAYDSNSDEGKKCRRLLKYFKTLCEKDPHFQNYEDLPDITDVSEPEIEMAPPPRSYRSLFGVQNNQSGSSMILAGSDRVENDVNDLENLTELASSTIVNSIPAKQTRPALSTVFEAPVAASIEECSIDISMSDLSNVSYITTPPQSTTVEPFVTPPPPYVPTPPGAPSSSPLPRSARARPDRGRGRRGRGRPRLTSCPAPPPSPASRRGPGLARCLSPPLSPPARRGRGRPRLGNRSQESRRGRPKKNI